jgi:hypothetical protein
VLTCVDDQGRAPTRTGAARIPGHDPMVMDRGEGRIRSITYFTRGIRATLRT